MRYSARVGTILLKICLLMTVLMISSCQPAKTIEQELAEVTDSERQALTKLLNDAGLQLKDLRSIGVYGIENNPRAVAFYQGHIAAISITDTNLASMDSLTNLPYLQAIWLVNNKLTTIAGLSSGAQLRDLNLSGNQLAALTGLEYCSELTSLNAAKNKLTSTRGIANLKRLKDLDLRSNQLEDLTGLAELPKLTNLDLSSNRLSLVTGLEKIPNLEALNLDNNQIKSLSGLKELANLKSITAKGNQISDLTPLFSFRLLRDVDLSNNLLTSVPSEVNKWIIKIDGNPIGLADADTPPTPTSPLPKNVVVAMPPVGSEATAKTAYFKNSLWGFEYNGGFDNLTGTGIVEVLDKPKTVGKSFPKAKLEISVGQGKVRAYMYYYDGHYLIVDAIPGNPGKLKGRLFYGSSFSTKYILYVQSLDGQAGDVNVRVYDDE